MQYNHQHVTKSASADQIEQEIDSSLKSLQLLFDELRARILQKIQPEKLFQKRWVWLVVISFFLWLKMCHLFKIFEKKQLPCICITHHHWHHFLLFPRKKSKR
jgi:hypothetical protein